MECTFGITGKGYAIIASDSNAARSIIKMKGDEDKMKVLSRHLVMAYSGESGDTLQFSEYIERNLQLYSIRHHVELRPRAAAAWIRNQLAESLRSRNAYQVNLLLAGFDVPASTPALYWVDYLGTSIPVPFGAHGYGAHLTLSTMDRYHRPDMSLEEGLDLLRRCINQLKLRFIVDLGQFKVRVVDRDGVREVTL
ncbi:20s proteasome subunit [Ceraceosorus bombacis]|uniref:Proteasome subunit beta n=2 Tax=Ceraceosorus TaxID=401624 RepID=A0A0P1BB71_9BASI|nr:putative multicatalytic endopeptidase complex chain PRE1 [Ceraceosorus guamensis]PWN44709.1 putative multicatalytic endopeptidase complex chain PRE1 [Ceraceosorus guamensis]CEH13329.1 20s proteasome subunit [Ceraceosorus bombacis]